MDELDRRLLTIIQKDFPICARPYAVIAEEVGLSEAKVIERIAQLKEESVVRRLGAVFDSNKLGYVSTLCAARVSPEQLTSVNDFLNDQPAVTHNYLRDHHYNVWFTLIVPQKEKIAAILKEFQEKTGVSEVLNLPARRRFKVRVVFDLVEGGGRGD